MESVDLDDQNIGGLSSIRPKHGGSQLAMSIFISIVDEFFMITNFDGFFSQNFCECPLKFYIWSLLTRTPKMTHFESQTIP